MKMGADKLEWGGQGGSKGGRDKSGSGDILDQREE